MAELGVSQAALARRIGISQQAVGKLVHGHSRETPKLYQIARELSTTPAYLAGETDDPNGDPSGVSPLTSEERQWLDAFAALSADQRRALQLIARDLARGAGPAARLHEKRNEFGTPGQG